MRKHITTALLVAALGAVPVFGFAASPGKSQTPAPAKHESTRSMSTHATRGVVKSVDDSSLVITRSGKNKGEMTFVMNPSTHREGTIAVGSPVSIRYRKDGKTYVATAVSVQQPTQQAGRKAPSKR